MKKLITFGASLAVCSLSFASGVAADPGNPVSAGALNSAASCYKYSEEMSNYASKKSPLGAVIFFANNNASTVDKLPKLSPIRSSNNYYGVRMTDIGVMPTNTDLCAVLIKFNSKTIKSLLLPYFTTAYNSIAHNAPYPYRTINASVYGPKDTCDVSAGKIGGCMLVPQGGMPLK